MQLTRRQIHVFWAVLSAALLFAGQLFAEGGEWKLTGTGTRVKTIVLVNFDVYRISHFMKELPGKKSKQAVIDADVDKKFQWTMLREVEHDKVVQTLKDAFAMNGYTDGGKIGAFVGAFSAPLKDKSAVTIQYDAASKKTTVTVASGGTATVEGVDFMKAVWSIWFGKIDQPALGDALISKL